MKGARELYVSGFELNIYQVRMYEEGMRIMLNGWKNVECDL